MENDSEHSSCISPAPTSISDGSSWAVHIANFMVSSQSQQQAAASSESDYSSSFASVDADYASFVTSEAMCANDDLRDTASSSATCPKVCVDVNPVVNVEAKGITPQEKFFVHASSPQAPAIYGAHEVSIGDEKRSYECNELREKGLCLVPLSMLLKYLG